MQDEQRKKIKTNHHQSSEDCLSHRVLTYEGLNYMSRKLEVSVAHLQRPRSGGGARKGRQPSGSLLSQAFTNLKHILPGTGCVNSFTPKTHLHFFLTLYCQEPLNE